MTESTEPLSKSEVKRQFKHIQKLGVQLSELTEGQIRNLPLSEHLHDAVLELKSLTSNSAKKRQTQYLGKLLNKEDNLSEIQAAFERISGERDQINAQFHLAESWREQLLSDSKGSITAFMNEYPNTDSQALRHLVQKAQKELKQNSNLGARKALFRFVKQRIDDNE
jgi:ribosome-associated protein